MGAFAENKVVAVIATPKSGSTFVTNVIRQHGKLPARRLCYAYSSNEHELYVPALVTAKITGGVSQLHMRGTPHNLQLIQAFNIRSIILTRNVFDALASFREDVRKKLSVEGLGRGIAGYSFVWLTPDLLKLSDEELMDYCIDFYVPWYINFILSWQQCTRDPRFLFLRYESLMADKAGAFARITQLIGLPPDVPPELLDRNYLAGHSGIAATGGKTGYGLDLLLPRQKQAIEAKLRYLGSALAAEFMSLTPAKT